MDNKGERREVNQEFINKIFQGDWIEVAKILPADTFHCCITSPPYWGQRNYGCDGQLGLEKTPEEHIKKLVAGFREIRRILRPDGVLWLNYGDKYAGGGNNRGNKSPLSDKQASNRGATGQVADCYRVENLANGNLLGLPWRVALALQADDWWLRSDVIWAKALSFCPTYSGSTMPESVNGWRWERCRVKVKGMGKDDPRYRHAMAEQGAAQSCSVPTATEWSDCPGCPKCEKNGGLVLRRGSWRCTKAHEYLFMLTRSERYLCDMDAVREDVCESTLQRDKYTRILEQDGPWAVRHDHESVSNSSGRNLRDVWCINPQAYKGAHYATFPEKLVEPCIKVSTSQKGVCPKCGAPWARVIAKKKQINQSDRIADRRGKPKGDEGRCTVPRQELVEQYATLGWRATCDCGIQETVPAICYDPFMGSGTVAAVAARLGRNYCGSELSAKYLTEQTAIRVKAAEHGMGMAEVQAGQQGLFE